MNEPGTTEPQNWALNGTKSLSQPIIEYDKYLILLAGVEGLEPPTPGFGDRCSSH
jgi:hypothetical protein